MIRHIIASAGLVLAVTTAPALATHDSGPGVDLPGKSEYAPGRRAKETGQPATDFAPGLVKGDGESARDAAPGHHGGGVNTARSSKGNAKGRGHGKGHGRGHGRGHGGGKHKRHGG